MKKIVKQFSVPMIFASVISLAMGILLLFYSDSLISIAARAVAVCIMLIGIVLVISMINAKNIMGSAIAGVVAILGLWFLFKPEIVASFIPIIIGVVLVITGVQNLILALEAFRINAAGKIVILVIAIVSMILGVICIFNAFGVMNFAIQIIGIFMIVNSLANIFSSIFMGVNRKKHDEIVVTVKSK